MILSSEKEPMGIIGLADTLKEDAVEAVKRLQQMNIEVVMLTGDDFQTANAIAGKLGIKESSQMSFRNKGTHHKAIAKRRQGSGHGGRWRKRCSGSSGC